MENDNHLHISNACGIPILLRAGSSDRGVHPWFTRRMLRMAGEVCGGAAAARVLVQQGGASTSSSSTSTSCAVGADGSTDAKCASA